MSRWSNTRAGHSQQALFALALATLLPACATTTVVSLKAGTEFLPPAPIQVPLTVGFYYPPELSSRKHTIEMSNAVTRFIIPVGEASARLFEELSSSLFSRSVAVDRRPPLPESAAPVAAVLELNIEDSNIDARPFIGTGGRNLCWAEIVYRFTVYSPSGTALASWQVRGIGERVGSEVERLFTDAVELAMRDAAEKFQTSFFDVPEARRWIRGLPATNVNAPADAQTTLEEQKTAWAMFPGVAAASVEVARDAQAPNILSAKVRVRNEGDRRIFVRPFDVSVELQGSSIVRSAPASALAASVTPQLPRVPPLGYGPGFAFGPPGIAIGNLVAALINLSLMEAENRKIEEALARYRTEALSDVTLWQGDSVEFVVHFLGVPDPGTAQALAVPVIDLDTATRYVIRLPLR